MKSMLMLLSTYTKERARLPALYTHFNKHTSMSKACCRCICIFVEHNIRFAVYIFHFILFSKIIHRINGIMCHIESVHNLILAFIMEYLFIWEMLSNNDDGKRSPHIHTYNINSSTHRQHRQMQRQKQSSSSNGSSMWHQKQQKRQQTEIAALTRNIVDAKRILSRFRSYSKQSFGMLSSNRHIKRNESK